MKKTVIREIYNNYGHKNTDYINVNEINIKEDRSIKRKKKK